MTTCQADYLKDVGESGVTPSPDNSPRKHRHGAAGADEQTNGSLQ